MKIEKYGELAVIVRNEYGMGNGNVSIEEVNKLMNWKGLNGDIFSNQGYLEGNFFCYSDEDRNGLTIYFNNVDLENKTFKVIDAIAEMKENDKKGYADKKEEPKEIKEEQREEILIEEPKEIKEEPKKEDITEEIKPCRRTTIREEYQKGISMQGETVTVDCGLGMIRDVLVDGQRTLEVQKFIYADKDLKDLNVLSLAIQGRNTKFIDLEVYDKKGEYFDTYNDFTASSYDSLVGNQERMLNADEMLRLYPEMNGSFIEIVPSVFLQINNKLISKLSLIKFVESELFSGFGSEFTEKIRNIRKYI